MKEQQPQQPEALTKEQIWQQKTEKLSGTTDLLGKGIEEGVKDLIVGFWVNGIATYGSCEGHTKNGHISFPYIAGSALNEPDERFVGEKELQKRLMDKYGLATPNLIFGHDRAEKEFDAAIEEDDYTETDIYKEWYPKNKDEIEKVQKLIDEFYILQQKHPDYYVRLVPIHPGWRIEFFDQESAENINNKIDIEKVKASIIVNVKGAQEEMHRFANFIKQKYFK